MKTYTIVAIIPITNTLELRDPDNGSIQYYKLPHHESARDYKVGQELTI